MFLPRVPWSIPKLGRAMYNFGMRTKVGKNVNVTTQSFKGLKVVVYSPMDKQPKSGILWCFGGGHLGGYPEHLNSIASLAVQKLGVAIFAPKYRLAPEHPFPADIDDCFKAWTWLTSQEKLHGFTLNKFAIAGHSAGGGIAAALTQRILDNGGIQPEAQCLFYPMLDDRTALDEKLTELNHFSWNNKTNLFAWNAYLNPYKSGAKELPLYAAAARRRDLSGLPPTWIGKCGLDLFYDEYTTYAKRLNEAGVLCETYEAKGVPHAFEVLISKTEVAKNFEAAGIAFLKKYLN